MKPRLYNVSAIAFRRSENSGYEPGLIFNEDRTMMIDQFGDHVESCYDYETLTYDFSINLAMVFDAVSARYQPINLAVKTKEG